MKKIKVMRIIARLNIGGPAIHTMLLNEGLGNNGFETSLIVGSPDAAEGDMAYIAKEKGLKITVIPELGRRIRLLPDAVALWKLLQIIRKEKPDIIHTHTAKAGVLGRCAAIFNGVPIKVHSFHGHVFHGYFNPAAAKGFILIERFFARFTNRIIVVSDGIKNEICSRFNIVREDKTSVIRLGLDMGRFKDSVRLKGAFRRQLGIGEGILLVGIVGRLVPVKNHKLFLRTVKLLKDEKPDLRARFLIIGDGELRHELEVYAASLGIRDWLLFTGWQKDMPLVYADLDIVVLTSLNEGTPLSLIEAMAAQRAVVATAVGGVPDVVRDKENGLLVEANNVIQLKDAILRLLSNEGMRREMGQRASEYVCAKYSKERLIMDMERLYKELIRIKKDKKG